MVFSFFFFIYKKLVGIDDDGGDACILNLPPTPYLLPRDHSCRLALEQGENYRYVVQYNDKISSQKFII